jgi:hypothetical protein
VRKDGRENEPVALKEQSRSEIGEWQFCDVEVFSIKSTLKINAMFTYETISAIIRVTFKKIVFKLRPAFSFARRII